MKVAKFSRGKGKYLLIGLAIYAALFFILMLIKGDIFKDNPTMVLWFGELRNNNHDFLISYFASSLDSLVFFILVGGAAILISVKDPSDEMLYQKINYIFPETKRDSYLAKYIQDEISSLACIATDTKRSINIQEVSPCAKYIKLDIKGRSHIKNIFNNHHFISDSMRYRMLAEPVSFTQTWGEMLEASITKDVSKPISAEQHLSGTIELNKDKKSHTEAYPINLGPDEVALYCTHGWFWQSLTDDLKSNTSRFIEKSVYDVKNNLDRDITFTIKSNKLQTSLSEKFINKIKNLISNPALSPEDTDELNKLINPHEDDKKLKYKNYTLLPGKEISIIFNNVRPSDKIELTFQLPEPKE